MTISLEQLNDILHSFSTFRYAASPSLFLTIFGERIGYHLWNKFTGYNYDVVKFYCYLDTENSNKLSEYLIKETQ